MNQSETIFGGANTKKLENIVKTHEDKVSKNKVSEKDLTLPLNLQLSILIHMCCSQFSDQS